MAGVIDWKDMLKECSSSPYPAGYKNNNVCECLDGTDEKPGRCADIQSAIVESCGGAGNLSRVVLRLLEEDDLLRTAATFVIIGGSVVTLKLLYR